MLENGVILAWYRGELSTVVFSWAVRPGIMWLLQKSSGLKCLGLTLRSGDPLLSRMSGCWRRWESGLCFCCSSCIFSWQILFGLLYWRRKQISSNYTWLFWLQGCVRFLHNYNPSFHTILVYTYVRTDTKTKDNKYIWQQLQLYCGTRRFGSIHHRFFMILLNKWIHFVQLNWLYITPRYTSNLLHRS